MDQSDSLHLPLGGEKSANKVILEILPVQRTRFAFIVLKRLNELQRHARLPLSCGAKSTNIPLPTTTPNFKVYARSCQSANNGVHVCRRVYRLAKPSMAMADTKKGHEIAKIAEDVFKGPRRIQQGLPQDSPE